MLDYWRYRNWKIEKENGYLVGCTVQKNYMIYLDLSVL